MTDSTNENQEAPVIERTASVVINDLRIRVGKLGRQEVRAVEADKMAATFNKEIIEMATGVKTQTPDRSIATISAEQAKHVKRAAKVRETNTELAAEIRGLETELSAFLETLLTPYPVAEVSEDDTPEDDTEQESEEDNA